VEGAALGEPPQLVARPHLNLSHAFPGEGQRAADCRQGLGWAVEPETGTQNLSLTGCQLRQQALHLRDQGGLAADLLTGGQAPRRQHIEGCGGVVVQPRRIQRDGGPDHPPEGFHLRRGHLQRLRQRVRGRCTPLLVVQLPDLLPQLCERVHLPERQAHGATAGRQGVLYCPADPSHGIGEEADAACRIEPARGVQQAEVPRIDQIVHRQPPPPVALGDADHKAQVALDEFVHGGGLARGNAAAEGDLFVEGRHRRATHGSQVGRQGIRRAVPLALWGGHIPPLLRVCQRAPPGDHMRETRRAGTGERGGSYARFLKESIQFYNVHSVHIHMEVQLMYIYEV
jgi:hypothetical protein